MQQHDRRLIRLFVSIIHQTALILILKQAADDSELDNYLAKTALAPHIKTSTALVLSVWFT